LLTSKLLDSTQETKQTQRENKKGTNLRPSKTPIIPTILTNNPSRLRAPHFKIAKQQIRHAPPPPSSRFPITLIIAIAPLDQLANPRLDVGRIADAVLRATLDDASAVDVHVGDGGVVEVLAQGADGDAVAGNAGYVVDVDVGRARFYGDAVVAALVGEVG
jgi:hypothetical protein